MHMSSQPGNETYMSSTGPATPVYDKDTYTVLAGQLFDSYALELVLRQLIKVHKLWGLILDVSTYKHVDYLNLRMNNPNWFFLALWT
jgi:hypothetical protein